MTSTRSSENPASPWLDVEWDLRELIESERYQRNQDIKLLKQTLEARLTKLETLMGADTKSFRELTAHSVGKEKQESQTTFDCIFGSRYDPQREEGDALLIQDEDSEHEPDTICLHPTIWDSAVLVAEESQAEGKTILRHPFTLSMILLNVLVQLVFIVGLRTSLSRNPYSADVRESMRTRRLYENQAWHNVDFATGETKANTLCNGGVFNSLGETLEELDVYTSGFSYGFDSWESFWNTGIVSSLPGGYIAMVAMLIWILSMTAEIRRAVQIMIAVLALPRRQTGTVLHVIASSTIVYMRRRNKVFLICVAFVPRLVVGVLLLFSGIRFIAYTSQVGELILNACALEIVKSVDEYIFSAFPKNKDEERISETSVLVKHEKGVVGFIMASNRNRQFHKFGLLACVLGVLCHGLQLQNQFNNDIQNAKDDVCGHDISFAWAAHPLTGMPTFTHFGKGHHTELNVSLDSMSCYYASITEMLQIRAGFSPKYFPDDPMLRRQINGSAPSCTLEAPKSQPPLSSNISEKTSCPQVPLATFNRIQALSQIEYIEMPDCSDQNIAYMVMRRTCLSKSFLSSEPALGFLETRSDCKSVADICTCAPNETNPLDGGCNLQSPSASAEQRFNIERVWILLLRRLCPATCGISEKSKVCGKPPLKHHDEGKSKGRR